MTTKGITIADIEARVTALAEQLKDAERRVSEAKMDPHRAERQRDDTKAELEAWKTSLEALKKAGVR